MMLYVAFPDSTGQYTKTYSAPDDINSVADFEQRVYNLLDK